MKTIGTRTLLGVVAVSVGLTYYGLQSNAFTRRPSPGPIEVRSALSRGDAPEPPLPSVVAHADKHNVDAVKFNAAVDLPIAGAPRPSSDAESDNSTLERYADLPDWAAPCDGVHMSVYRDPIHGLYSSEPQDRHAALCILVDRLSLAFDQGVWNECLKALERLPRDERQDLLGYLLVTGREQGVDLQVQELRHPDVHRRFDALDCVLGVLGGETRNFQQAGAWLSGYWRAQAENTDPNQHVLRYIDRVEPIARMILRSDSDPMLRQGAVAVVRRCEEARRLIEDRKRIPGMDYPSTAVSSPSPKK